MKERKNDDFRCYYDILRKIGKGAFNVVYEVKMKNSNEKRAIKIYDKYDLDGDYKQFYKEIEIRKILEDKNNDNALKYYEYFINEEELAIVVELCDNNIGHLLREKREGFKIKEIKEILNQLNNSFKIMSKNNIVHRNISLNNILIKFNKEKTKYIAKLDVSHGKEGTRLGSFDGQDFKARFMAPETLSEAKYNEKSDLWCLGILIYFLYFKKFPYNGNTEFIIFKQIKINGIKYLEKTENSDLDNLIRKLLTVDPNKRLSWKEYFNRPFFINNNSEDKNLCKQNNENKEKDINENNELIKQLSNKKNKNEKLNKKISDLENEIKNEKSKNKNLEEEVKQLKNSICKLKKESENNKKYLENSDIKDYYKIILEKEKEIIELKNKLLRFPFTLNEGENLMPVNFQSINESINYIVICKNTGTFNIIEKKFYEENAEYLEYDNYFKVKGKKINKYKSLEENKICNNDVIIINQIIE